jgi:hypothetical protein
MGSTATFCGECVKTCEDVAPKFGENRPGFFTMTTLRLTRPPPAVSGEILNGCHPHPPYFPDLASCDFFLFPKMELNLIERWFATNEETQAESQRVLDTVTEKDFQEAVQKWRRRSDQRLHGGGNYFEDNGGQ